MDVFSDSTKRYLCYGCVAGFLNGLLGAGGGAILVPLLLHAKLSQQHALATSLSIMLPLSLFTVLFYGTQGNLSLHALPYCIGGSLGGYLGSQWFQKTSPQLLKRLFALLLFVSGVRGFL